MGRTRQSGLLARRVVLAITALVAALCALHAAPPPALAYQAGAHYALIMNIKENLPAGNIFKKAIETYPDYAAWGSDGPDIPAAQTCQAPPIGRASWFDATHYQQVGPYCRYLLQQAVLDSETDPVHGQEEMAFAAGYVSHVVGDMAIHGILVNPEAGIGCTSSDDEKTLHHNLEGWADIYTWVYLADNRNGYEAKLLTPYSDKDNYNDEKLYSHFVGRWGTGKLTIADDDGCIERLIDRGNKAVVLANGERYSFLTGDNPYAVSLPAWGITYDGSDYLSPTNMRAEERLFALTLGYPWSTGIDELSWIVSKIRKTACMYKSLDDATGPLATTGNARGTSTPLTALGTREQRVIEAWTEANTYSDRLLCEAAVGNYTHFSDSWIADAGLDDGRGCPNLTVTIQTGVDTYWKWYGPDGAGTDKDVYFGVQYANGEKFQRLLDTPGYNDFESGDRDIYYVPTYSSQPISNITKMWIRLSNNGLGDWPLWDLWQLTVTANNRVIYRSAAWDHWTKPLSGRTFGWGIHDGLDAFSPGVMPDKDHPDPSLGPAPRLMWFTAPVFDKPLNQNGEVVGSVPVTVMIANPANISKVQLTATLPGNVQPPVDLHQGVVSTGGWCTFTGTWDYDLTGLPAGQTVPVTVTVTDSQGTTSSITHRYYCFTPPVDVLPPETFVIGDDDGWHRTPVELAFGATDEGSGVFMTQVRLDNGGWWAVDRLTVPAPSDHSGDGIHVVQYRSVDNDGNYEDAKTIQVRIDTRRPATQALSDPVVRYRNKGVLKVAVTDPLPNSGCAIVTIKVTTSKGKLLHAISLGQQPIDTVIKIPFAWTMKAGRYRYKVLATDLAGNPQGKIGRGVIRVR